MCFFLRFLCALVLAYGLATSTQASAQGNYSKEELAEARELFKEGVSLLKDSRYVEACAKFEASLQRVDGLGTRGKLAECYERVGRIASAWKMYRSIQDLARLAGDDLRERVSGRRADDIEPRLSYLIIDARNVANEKNVAIEDNGVVISPERWGSRIPVDQGRHVVVVFIKGNRLWSKDVLLQEAATLTVTVPARKTVEPLAVDKPSRSNDSPPAPQSATEPAPSVGSSGPAEPGSGNQGLRISGMALVGIGAGLALGGGGYFAWRANSLWNDADPNCDRVGNEELCSPEAQETANDARTAARRADISVLAGVAVAATGGVLWWLSSSRGSSESEANDTGVALSISDEGAGMWVYGRF